MQPFDEISTAELGIEDDVLLDLELSSQDRYLNGVPKWMRPSGPGSQATTTLGWIRRVVLPAVAKWLTATVRRLTPVIASLLRPRLTARYIVFSIVALWGTYRVLVSQPLLSNRLPGYTGPYGVGALDIEFPLETPRRVNGARFKSKSDGDYAFEVETVLFTLYYPISPKARGSAADRYYWLPKPVSATARGYARFLGMDNFFFRGLLTGGLWLTAGGIRIPAEVGAPLIPSAEVVDIDGTGGDVAGSLTNTGEAEGGEKLPAMVFTHGLLSSRTDYTHYLGELASRGVIVAAIEHRDGSSPASRVIKAGGGDAAPRWRYAFGVGDLAPPAEGERAFDMAALKQAQLSFREAEIEAAVDALRALDSGSPSPFPNSRAPPRDTDMSAFKGRIDTTALTIAGHSYGGTGALRALRPPTSASAPSRLPFSGGVILDPGKSSGPLNADVRVPLAIFQSGTWSKPGPSLFYGRPHFDVVRDIVDGVNNHTATRGASDEKPGEDDDDDSDDNDNKKEDHVVGAGSGGGWFLTSLGTAHPSITDASLLQPLALSWATGSTLDARDGIMQYVLATRDFVRYQHTGERRGVLGLSGRPIEDGGAAIREYDPGHNEGMPKPWHEYWQIHVAPE